MADFLAVLGILGFVLVSLGLIWALDRVWHSPKAFFSASRSWCSSIWDTPCSSPRSS